MKPFLHEVVATGTEFCDKRGEQRELLSQIDTRNNRDWYLSNYLTGWRIKND